MLKMYCRTWISAEELSLVGFLPDKVVPAPQRGRHVAWAPERRAEERSGRHRQAAWPRLGPRTRAGPDLRPEAALCLLGHRPMCARRGPASGSSPAAVTGPSAVVLGASSFSCLPPRRRAACGRPGAGGLRRLCFCFLHTHR